MSEMARSRTEPRKAKARAGKARKPPAHSDSADLSKGAAAAQRASAGMGTADLEPTDWLFGDTLRTTTARSY